MEYRIVAIEWFDAGYTDKDSSVDVFPPTQHTFGVLMGETDEYVHVTVNMYCENDAREPIDGFFIPKSTIIRMSDIGLYTNRPDKAI
jgi:hypothetical protein